MKREIVFFRIGGAWDWVAWVGIVATAWPLPSWRIAILAVLAGILQYCGERYGESHPKGPQS